jgi:hypothetical protein
MMESLIMLVLSSGEQGIKALITGGLDSLYAVLKAKAAETTTPIDDKSLKIIVEAIHQWEPKNL